MDLMIREFQNAIINYVNGTQLPMEVKRLALRDICAKLDAAADDEVRKQIMERDEAEKAAAKSETAAQAANNAATESTGGGGAE